MGAYHIPVLLEESIQGLHIKSGGVYVDATFGGGGHSREILKRLGNGKLFAFDQDKDAASNAIDDKRFFFIMHNFRFLKNFLTYYDVDHVDGILADLGVSSHDFDVPGRGFSYRFEGNLDMRMNRGRQKNAVTVINNYSEENLVQIFRDYGEIKNARKLADCIVGSRSKERINTTNQLKESISSCLPGNFENKYLSKVYQALRMEVNQEIHALKELLNASLDVLKPKGILAVITYHSIEDRLVKNFIRSGNFDGTMEKDFYGNTELPFRVVNKKVITPGLTELNNNPRARSAKLRIAEKI